MRQLPMMALIQPSFEGTKYLCLNAPGMPTLKLDVDLNDNDVEAKMLEYCVNPCGELITLLPIENIVLDGVGLIYKFTIF